MRPPSASDRRRHPGGAVPTLPVDVLTQVLASLDLSERQQVATICRDYAEAVRLNTRSAAVDLRLPSRHAPTLPPTRDARLALVSPAAAESAGCAAAAASLASVWDPEAYRLWGEAAPGRRGPAKLPGCRHLAHAVDALWSGGRAGPAAARPRSLSLLLIFPEFDTSTSEVHRLIQAAGAGGLFDAVAMPQGMLRLDGALASTLAWANVPAATLPAALQAGPPYARLERLALKLCPDDDLPSILAAVQPGTLPALRCLALVAPPGTDLAADMGALAHRRLERLDLRNVQLPAGFASLAQLSGLRCLAVRYDEEEEAPPLNLQGDLSALSALKQLDSLSVDCLASGEGLPSLSALTNLSLAPQQGACIALCSLPRLRRLAVDLSAGSCGRDLLSEEHSTVHVPAQGHGLSSLQELELRCMVWRPWQASEQGPGSQQGDGGGSDSGSEAGSSVAGSSEASSDDQGSSSDGSSGQEAGAEAEEEEGGMWEEQSEQDAEEEEAEAEEEEAAAGQGMAGLADGLAGEEAPAGLLDASWGWLQQDGPGDEQGQAHAVTLMEQRYLAGLLTRLPTLKRIQLTDYMGRIDPSTLLPPTAQGGKPGTAAAAEEAAGGGGRAGTPALALPAAGAPASSLPGWQLAVTETPVLGGLSQFDLLYSQDP